MECEAGEELRGAAAELILKHEVAFDHLYGSNGLRRVAAQLRIVSAIGCVVNDPGGTHGVYLSQASRVSSNGW